MRERNVPANHPTPFDAVPSDDPEPPIRIDLTEPDDLRIALDPPEHPFDSVPVPPPMGPGWTMITAEDDERRDQCERLEYEVFVAAGFCDPDPRCRVVEYEPWRAASSFKAALSPEGLVRGTVRTLVGPYDLLPAGKFSRDRPWPEDPVLEYASLAVDDTMRGTGVAESLYRAVWQDALRLGAGGIVAISAEWMLDILNGVYDLGFRHLGPSRWYMGGDCFPMGTAVRDLIHRLQNQPSFFAWASAEIDLRDLPMPVVRQAVAELRSRPEHGG